MYLFSDVWPVLWDGNIRLRGKVWFCETGTTTSKNIFDKDGVALTNPILTNADGRTNVQVILDGDYTAYMYRYIGTDTLMDDDDPNNWLLLYDELILEGSGGTSVASSTNVETVAALKALPVGESYFSVILLGYYTGGDKPAVSYTWYPLATADEDGGSVIASDNSVTGRWLLTIPNVIDVRDFGVFPSTGATTQNAYSSQLTSCLTYSEKAKRPVKFSSINKVVVGYSYYSFEGGSFNLSTQKVLIDDNVRFLGKDNTETSLIFPLIEKNSKLLIDTDHSNGTTHLISDVIKTSWRGSNNSTSTILGNTYIVDSSAIIAGSDGGLVDVLFDGTTGIALTASFCRFIDNNHSSVLNDVSGTISITNSVDFKVSYLAGKSLESITITDTNIICDAVLAVRSDTPTTGTPVTGVAYNFSRIDEGTLVCGYFDSNTNVYRVSQYKTVWDALTNRVQVLDLEGKTHECVDPLYFIDPSIVSGTPRKIMNGTINITDSVYSPETTGAKYIFDNVTISPDTIQWGEIDATNSNFYGSNHPFYVGTGSNFVNCIVDGQVSTDVLHASNTIFNGTVVVGRPNFDHDCNFMAGLTISGNEILSTEEVIVKNYDSSLATLSTWAYNLYVIRGYIRDCAIVGNVDIIPRSDSYNTVVRGLIIEGHTLYDGNFTSSTVIADVDRYAKGFVISWRRPEFQGMVQPSTGIPWDGSALDPIAADESPNQFVIKDNVRKINSAIELSYVYNQPPVDIKVVKSTEFEGSFMSYSSSPHITLAAEYIENFIFKLCNDTFTPFYSEDGSTVLTNPLGSSCSNVNMVYTTVVLYHPKTSLAKFYTNDRWYRIKAYGPSQYISCETA